MDKLFNKGSRLGWLSISPILVVALFMALITQSFIIYTDLVSLLQKYKLNEDFIFDFRSLLTFHLFVGLGIVSLFGALLFGIYLFERIRRSKQNKDLSNNLKNLSIVSMIKEKGQSIPREKL